MNKNKNEDMKNFPEETPEKPLELYTEEEAEAVEKHIEQHFGRIMSYFSEKRSENIKLTINVIPPNREHPYYTLVTSGMGAHIMNVPEHLAEKHLERAEFVICMPPDWKIDSEDNKDKWCLRLLSLVTALPINENEWLGWGHSIDYGDSFAGDFCSVMIIFSMFGKDSVTCELPDGSIVNFYQVMPLYRNELDFKNKNGASALISFMTDEDLTVADPERPCRIPDNFNELLDTVEKHSDKIINKNLDLLEINGANHIAAFLRWSLEHDLIDSDFLEYFADDIEQITSGKYDIRRFVINSLGGELTTDIYTAEGKAFCNYYYDHYAGENEPCYPRDVDKMALDYFGEEKYNCEEFDDEAYLFVPFDEEYYTAISKYIDENYTDFHEAVKRRREQIVDFYDRHQSKIVRKKLDIPEINGVNHIAAFLRWCIENDLMNETFMKFYNELEEKPDIRQFIINYLDGELTFNMFSAEGQDFIKYYYFFGEHDCPTYPGDVDRMALNYFGKEKYNCKEFDDEAYLFVPFDEDYYKAMSKYIKKSYRSYLESIVIDSYEDHAYKIDEKNLDTDRINAANHITAFLRWCIENDLTSKEFMRAYSRFLKKNQDETADLREVFIEAFDGILSGDMLTSKGRQFAEFYYSFTCEPPSYPDDVDRMALKFFGKRKYNSKKFQDEAYLFVPFDEDYYTAMSRYIDHAYSDFCYFLEYGKLPD